jgi:hypothetical protein
MTTRLLCALVRGYQLYVSPLLPRSCRFYPSCSEYMIQSIRCYGVARGLGRGLWRIMRCNPFCAGGYDPVTPLPGHPACLDHRPEESAST